MRGVPYTEGGVYLAYEPRIEMGVDQFTVTFFSPLIEKMQADPDNKQLNSAFWNWHVNHVVMDVLKKTMLEDVFGEKIEIMKFGITQGYDSGYTLPNYDIAICWHSVFAYWKMGVSLRFHAKAWHTFCENYETKYGMPMDIVSFMRLISDNLVYYSRFSRIDFTADFFNYADSSPDDIHTALSRGMILALNRDGNKPFRTKRAIETNGVHQTLELGSKKSPVFAVIYDKKEESISCHGYRYEDALRCKSWLRLEVRFHDTLAHQISKDIKNMDINDLKPYLAQRIVERYAFYINNVKREPIAITEDLLDIASGSDYGALSSPSPRDSDLLRSRDYLTSTSGLFSWLFKIRMTYDDVPDADRIAMDYLFDIYQLCYLPDAFQNYELKKWLSLHRTESRKRTLNELLT